MTVICASGLQIWKEKIKACVVHAENLHWGFPRAVKVCTGEGMTSCFCPRLQIDDRDWNLTSKTLI